MVQILMDGINREMALLHPRGRDDFLELERVLTTLFHAGSVPVHFRAFEVWRSPSRQTKLFKEGKSRARAWMSAHQYGLAVDFVPWTLDRGWHWDPPKGAWDDLRKAATKCGIINDLDWDRAHCEHPWFRELRPHKSGDVNF